MRIKAVQREEEDFRMGSESGLRTGGLTSKIRIIIMPRILPTLQKHFSRATKRIIFSSKTVITYDNLTVYCLRYYASDITYGRLNIY